MGFQRSAEEKLLENIHASLDELIALQQECDDHWAAEDFVYRFWHGSLKVYWLQDLTQKIVDALIGICPQNEQLNPWFTEIVASGTGNTFELAHNEQWVKHTQPIVDAYFHSRFMLDMVIKYGQILTEPPGVLPSGWAAVLTLYQIR